MIPRIEHLREEENWKKHYQNCLTSLDELAQFLTLPLDKLIPAGYSSAQMEHGFKIKVPLPYAERIKSGDINDPLLKQVLPTLEEGLNDPLFSTDPLQEGHFNPISGLLHKYQSRALMIVSGACPIHCRYCFRRHFSYDSNNPGKRQWEQSFKYLSDDKNINEVIYSGGDPLSLPDSYLQWLTEQVSAIPHIKRLRIHSRFPVVIPQRVTPSLIKWLEETPLQKVMVLHINHAQEIDESVRKACQRLKSTGTTLLNQSVLLNGINNSAEALSNLSEALFDAGVMPYYLHLPDKVAGTAHFDIHEADAVALHKEIQARLPGFLVPKLVREIPGRTSKTLIQSS